MEELYIKLCNGNLGEKYRIKDIETIGLMKRRLLDLGFIKNTIITPILISPSGDPVAYSIRSTVIALRKEVTSTILVEKI